MKISKEIKIDLYNRMVRQRTFEDETTVNFASGDMPGFCISHRVKMRFLPEPARTFQMKMPFIPLTADTAVLLPKALR